MLVVILAMGGAGYLLGRTFQGEGGGQSVTSPNRKWVAHAYTIEEWSVLGGKRTISELRVETAPPNPKLVRRTVIADTAKPEIDWRIEGEVFWNRNSSAVTFKAVTGKANVDVTWRDL